MNVATDSQLLREGTCPSALIKLMFLSIIDVGVSQIVKKLAMNLEIRQKRENLIFGKFIMECNLI